MIDADPGKLVGSHLAHMAIVRIGISGWRYKPWRGIFYPEGLPQRRELEYASRQLDTVEINGTFYSLQRPEFFAAWYDGVPEGFVFAIKGGRFITHMKKLRGVETALANFFASGPLRLNDKLGPILWQFPANFSFDEARIDDFLAQLPRDTKAASQLAARHDHRVAGRSWIEADGKQALRHAVEIRHPSFRTPHFVEMLRRHGVALVFADTVDWPYFEDVTADFIYIRLHGSEELYASGYSESDLDWWAARIKLWAAGGEPEDRDVVDPRPAPASKGRDVYVYFDNDAKVRAPFDAMSLKRRFGDRAQPAAPRRSAQWTI